MKYWTYILLLTAVACNNQQQSVDSNNSPVSKNHRNNDICWTGTLNGKTPVFIHYQLDSNLIVGEITYLNTKDRLPITLLGTIEDDKSYRLLEFDKTGHITGIIEGKPTEQKFNGIWVSPKSKKELAMALSLKDTLLISPNIKPDESAVFGNYHYQYGENGYSGNFDINKVGGNKIDFRILSLTNIERGPNIAEVEKDTIAITGNSFIYKIPDSDSCEFKATFYRSFVYVNYTKGYCESQFGLNATIDGIYLKTK
ncbi:MAG TPA: hypothetical protein VK484_06575 [Ferruginibacter sp.]|nr:hypothetical protein [Ferruginibacter sp.]